MPDDTASFTRILKVSPRPHSLALYQWTDHILDVAKVECSFQLACLNANGLHRQESRSQDFSAERAACRFVQLRNLFSEKNFRITDTCVVLISPSCVMVVTLTVEPRKWEKEILLALPSTIVQKIVFFWLKNFCPQRYGNFHIARTPQGYLTGSLYVYVA